MKKPKLNEETVRSELSESAFFRRNQPASTEEVAAPTAEPEGADSTVEPTIPRAEQGIDGRQPVRPYARTNARTLTRIPFEIYRDQHASLKRFSLEEQTRGEKGSMSQMVREALDMYIANRLRGEG